MGKTVRISKATEVLAIARLIREKRTEGKNKALKTFAADDSWQAGQPGPAATNKSPHTYSPCADKNGIHCTGNRFGYVVEWQIGQVTEIKT